MSESFEDLQDAVVRGNDLTAAEMRFAIGQIMTGLCTEEQIEGFLVALANKQEAVSELVGAAAAMRANMTPILSRHPKLLDTCGTGGGGSEIFNVSTTAALVIAAAGVPVAKHGNRSVTSRSGSADVLARLGVNIEATVPQVEHCLDELGICFCFAPLMHPAMKHVAAVRRRLGIRTIFNLLGPLANPAGACFQLLGVGLPETRELIASALAQLGTEHAFVVSGRDRLGEISLATTTDVTEVRPNGVKQYDWDPEDFGILRHPMDALQISGPEESAELVRSVLQGDPGPARDIVLLNAAAGLLVAGQTDQKIAAVRIAEEAIDSGAAAQLLDDLARLSHEPVKEAEN